MLIREFPTEFRSMTCTLHPPNRPNEHPSKGSNVAWAVRKLSARYPFPTRSDVIVTIADCKSYTWLLYNAVTGTELRQHQPIPCSRHDTSNHLPIYIAHTPRQPQQRYILPQWYSTATLTSSPDQSASPTSSGPALLYLATIPAQSLPQHSQHTQSPCVS
jgi:hypothetical protein